MMKMMMLLLKIILLFALIAALYVGGNILYATLTNFQPEEKNSLEVKNPQDRLPDSDEFSLLIWNIGYGGLGAKDDFFYDDGKTVISPKAHVDEYLNGIINFVTANSSKDFILLQEVDVNSKRSYYIDQMKLLSTALPQHAASYAQNYVVNFVPMPLFSINPMGKVDAGLGSFSKYKITEATRYQLPGSFPWPKSVYFLDRCILVHRISLPNKKDLLVVNIHNSAYDDTGELKAAEMAYIRKYLLEEYQKGNYIILGGDWNQSPPEWDSRTYSKSGDDYAPANINANTMPEGWQWAFDASSPTNRNLRFPYDAEKTSCTVIDFYLVSPNIEVVEVKTHDLKFAHSDHQPVSISIKLKEFSELSLNKPDTEE